MGLQLSQFTRMQYLNEYNADFRTYKYFLKTNHSLHLYIYKSVSHFTRNHHQKSNSLFIYAYFRAFLFGNI